MWLVLVLVGIVMFLLYRLNQRRSLSYKCFLLTMKETPERHDTFMTHHDPGVPLEVIYGVNTKNIENAKKYEKIIEPGYFKEALRLHYGKSKIRTDITHFDMGAIGCYMGHMEFYRRCFEQGLKYAVIFEDNVIVKDRALYDQIQSVIDVMGDDFDMCFFHCISRYPEKKHKGLEKVKWISSTKCYLIHVENMQKYHNLFYPIDNHVDMKHEDLIAKGARIYYKDMRQFMRIDRSRGSTIGHSDWGRKEHFSKQYPSVTTDVLEYGY